MDENSSDAVKNMAQSNNNPSTAIAQAATSTSLPLTDYDNNELRTMRTSIRRKITLTRQLTSKLDPFREQQDSETAEKSNIREFTKHTTLHGIDQLYSNTDRRSRCFWVVILFFVVGIVSFQVFRLVSSYGLNETVTSVKIVHPKFATLNLQGQCIPLELSGLVTVKILNAVGYLQPECVLCTEMSTALHDASYFGQKVGIDPRAPRAKELLKAHHIKLYDILREKWGTDNNIVKFAKELTFSCHDQFSMCWMENGAIFRCCEGLINDERILTVRPYLVHHGACYEFEANTYRQRIPGPVGGIGFVYLYPSEYLLYSAFNSYSGYALHLYTSPADAMLERNPTILPIGYHSHVRLQAKHSKRIEIDILRNDKCQDPKLKYFKEYSYSNCQAECLIDANIELCNCSGVAMVGSIPQEYTCDPLMAMNCYMNNVLTKQIDALAACRLSKCSEPCEYWSYDPTLTASRAFNPNLEQLQLDYWNLPPLVNHKSTIDSLIIGEIYFGDIQYTSIQEKEAISLEGFVSNLGGAIGLWTGASIISLIHLLYFFVLRKKFSAKRGKTIEIASLNCKSQL